MLSTSQMVKHVVDGQQLFFPTIDQILEIQKSSEIDGKNLTQGFLTTIERVLPYIIKYSELEFAIGNSGHWQHFPYIILKIQHNQQRVFMEELTCIKCNWHGMTCNPNEIDNYLGVPKNISPYQLMRYANRYPILPCPVCSSKLPRHPIWVEY